ncbi:signal peptidase complex subunit 2 [Tricharina praecox]|uniref:signal peptidase complex subunit 2 n=1 Tax=Tricharina praecox TaxID=43433 RepID=UPI00221FE17A|nr:signal peptidase complex subunit 2 [Tricharina praecox]KAI5846030.1 signal peptidase complex subunit 2 [Tricharina praecox]
MADKPKVNLYAISELKNTTDDAIPPYMKSLGFKQSNIYTDVRLAIGFTACAIAGATFYFDYTVANFEKTKEYTLYAVVAYFVLNTILTWWIWGVEGSKVFVGERNGVKIVLESSSEKYTPVYELKVTKTEKGKTTTTTAKNPFSGWYDQQGYFVEKPFMAFLQNTIPGLSSVDEVTKAN